MLITLPPVYGVDYSIKGNPVRQIAGDKSQLEGVLARFTRGSLKGFVSQPGVVDAASSFPARWLPLKLQFRFEPM
jgi:hypothetical protein